MQLCKGATYDRYSLGVKSTCIDKVRWVSFSPQVFDGTMRSTTNGCTKIRANPVEPTSGTTVKYNGERSDSPPKNNRMTSPPTTTMMDRLTHVEEITTNRPTKQLASPTKRSFKYHCINESTNVPTTQRPNLPPANQPTDRPTDRPIQNESNRPCPRTSTSTS